MPTCCQSLEIKTQARYVTLKSERGLDCSSSCFSNFSSFFSFFHVEIKVNYSAQRWIHNQKHSGFNTAWTQSWTPERKLHTYFSATIMSVLAAAAWSFAQLLEEIPWTEKMVWWEWHNWQRTKGEGIVEKRGTDCSTKMFLLSQRERATAFVQRAVYSLVCVCKKPHLPQCISPPLPSPPLLSSLSLRSRNPWQRLIAECKGFSWANELNTGAGTLSVTL